VYENLPDSSSDALQPRTHCCGPTAHVYIKSGTIGELTHCMFRFLAAGKYVLPHVCSNL